ncbi:MAG: GntR family transcriptional regulator [Deltaproteobacteria bacterium]|nr:GntR family transcriptional regulator [Candidatus Anaeroferrophillus wilburensis]MBN2889511.1 GntR family transcriptional regulator [Deltaproteobacteria bacterium]
MKSNISEIIASHKTLREKIAELLREAIIQQKIKPGERVTELEIASRFGLSRTPIREAFRQLESEGFLTIIPRKGAMVASLEEKDIRDFYEIKAVLEGYAARIAAEHISDDEIAKLERLNAKIRECADRQDVAGMTRVHNEFHQLILEICGNQKIMTIVSGLVRQFLRFRFFVSASSQLDKLLADHENIIAAFKAHDGSSAEKYIMENAKLGEDVLLKEFLANGAGRA